METFPPSPLVLAFHLVLCKFHIYDKVKTLYARLHQEEGYNEDLQNQVMALKVY